MENHLPEEPQLQGTTLRDPFWQAVFEVRHTKTDACERALIAQTEQDESWHQRTKNRLTVEGLTGDEFDAAFTTETQAYFYRSRSRCVCGDHLLRGFRS